MKKLFKALVALLMACSLVGCSSDSGSSSTGSVYYLNFKPEADETWQTVAKLYTEKTGVEVKVVTAASGNYETTLISELGKSNAPTLFNIGNAGAVATYGDYALDLTDTDVYNEMTTHAFDQTKDGKTLSIGYCYESYGIIVNLELLKKAGHDISEIKDFASLKAVVEDIHANAATLGFDAFTSSGLDSSSSWRFSGHLANIPLYYTFKDAGQSMTEAPATISDKYLANYKNIWDLYINNSTATPLEQITKTGDEAEAEFYNGQAVFYQNGSWEYANLTAKDMKSENLQMIPIYIGVDGEENSGLSSGTENCWAVNSSASEADQKATLDFLYWCVTDSEPQNLLTAALGAMPFKNAAASDNKFLNDANELLAAGKYNVDWAFNTTPNVDTWRAGVVSALSAYCKDQTDANWAQVTDAYVNGWATQYNAANK